MRCLKCGTDIEEHKAFCESCLTGMKDYPIPRETPAVILPRPKVEAPRPRAPKAEELLAESRKSRRRLAWLCALLLLISLSLGGLLFLHWSQDTGRPIGQTYTTNANQQETTP